MGPELVVADEPVSMLDVSIRTELLRLMLDLRKERGLTYLFITHDLSLAWVIADRIAVMYLGKIMEIGPAEDVIKQSAPSVHPGARRRLAVARPGRRRGPRGAGHPRGRDAERRGDPVGLPVPSALPAGVRPLPDRGAAAVRRRRRAAGRLLAGRGRRASCRSFQTPATAAAGRARRPCRRRADVADGPSAPDGSTAIDPSRRVTDPPLGIDRIADLLEASASTILAELEALGPEARWRPAPGEWCANECLGHILEAERRGFNGRIRTILAGDRPALQGWDQVAVAAARRDDRARAR